MFSRMATPRGFQPKNGEIFNKSGHGPSVFNGFGMTKTPQSPTLFITNLPQSVTMEMLEKLFASEPGFQRLRTVRHMLFIDFYDIKSATAAMRVHQNHVFDGCSVGQGIMIDYDKDPRQKRNKALTAQLERGAYSRGLSHELGDPSHARVHAAAHGHAAGSSARPPHAAPDPTLDLINRLKRDHALAQGVVVPLDAPPLRVNRKAAAAMLAGPEEACPVAIPDKAITAPPPLPPGRLIRRGEAKQHAEYKPKRQKPRVAQAPVGAAEAGAEAGEVSIGEEVCPREGHLERSEEGVSQGAVKAAESAEPHGLVEYSSSEDEN